VQMVFRPEDHLPLVSADPIQITQVLLNLVLNAIQAMSDLNDGERKITIETRSQENGLIEVSVTDNGPGVAPDVQPRIFEQFFTTKPQGLGMGLSISKSIIEAHGGQLWCNDGANGGAVFRMTLPIRRAQPAEVADHANGEMAADAAPSVHDSGQSPSEVAGRTSV